MPSLTRKNADHFFGLGLPKKGRLLSYALLSLIFCLIGFNVMADEKSDVYQVEVLIFRYNKGFDATRESWPQKIDRMLPANGVLPDATGTTPSDSPYIFLDNSRLSFKPYLASLQRAEGVKSLYHIAWQQHKNNDEAARPLWVQAGTVTPDGQHELEGNINLSINADMVVTVDLLLANYVQAGADTSKLPTPNPQSAAAEPATNQYVTSQVARMQETRQVKFNELHYFDHPLFGMLLRVTR